MSNPESPGNLGFEADTLAKVIPFPAPREPLPYPEQPYVRQFYPLPAEQPSQPAWAQRIRRLGGRLLDFALEKGVNMFEAYDKMRGRRGRSY